MFLEEQRCLFPRCAANIESEQKYQQANFDNIRERVARYQTQSQSRDKKKSIQALYRYYGVTAFNLHLAVFRALISRYADTEYLTIGMGDPNRTEDEMMGTIGPFVNLLPLRNCTRKNAKFEALLKETSLKSLATLTGFKYPSRSC